MKSFLLVSLLALAIAEATNDHWALTQTSTCAIIDSNASGSIVFGKETIPFEFDNATVSGSCASHRDTAHANTMRIGFFPMAPNGTILFGQSEEPWELELVFLKDKEDEYMLVDWTLQTHNFSGFDLEDTTFHRLNTSSLEFVAKVNEGFKCTSLELAFENGTKVELKDIHAIAFANLPTTELPKDLTMGVCKQDDQKTSKVVPIIVGCLLGGLVLGVLVAYMIGRYRARNQGYASV